MLLRILCIPIFVSLFIINDSIDEIIQTMKQINKGRRNELKKLKYKKRLKNMSLDENMPNSNFNAYKSHSTPCSCFMCRGIKYRDSDRKKNKKIDKNNLDF